VNPRIAAVLAMASGLFARGFTSPAGVAPAQTTDVRSGPSSIGNPAERAPSPRNVNPSALEQLFRAVGRGAISRVRYSKRTGWTNASYRRAALKRRNVLRNRKAHARAH
jgi:hypothetical protein